MAMWRKLVCAEIEGQFSLDSDSDGYVASWVMWSNVVLRTMRSGGGGGDDDNEGGGPYYGGGGGNSARGNIHKEGAVLSTHLLQLPGVSIKWGFVCQQTALLLDCDCCISQELSVLRGVTVSTCSWLQLQIWHKRQPWVLVYTWTVPKHDQYFHCILFSAFLWQYQSTWCDMTQRGLHFTHTNDVLDHLIVFLFSALASFASFMHCK
jgi:hypothetical protein